MYVVTPSLAADEGPAWASDIQMSLQQAAPQQSVAAAAEAGYFSYQAALQREAEPELSIQLPAAAPQAAAAGAQTAAAPDARPADPQGSMVASPQQAGAAANGTASAGVASGVTGAEHHNISSERSPPH